MLNEWHWAGLGDNASWSSNSKVWYTFTRVSGARAAAPILGGCCSIRTVAYTHLLQSETQYSELATPMLCQVGFRTVLSGMGPLFDQALEQLGG